MPVLTGWRWRRYRGGRAVRRKDPRRLGGQGLRSTRRHTAPLITSTRRRCATSAKLEFLAEIDGVAVTEMLREQPISAHWHACDGEAPPVRGDVCLLASTVAAFVSLLQFGWYRTPFGFTLVVGCEQPAEYLYNPVCGIPSARVSLRPALRRRCQPAPAAPRCWQPAAPSP